MRSTFLNHNSINLFERINFVFSLIKTYLESFLIPARGISEGKRRYYAQMVIGMLWLICTPLGLFAIYYDIAYLPYENYFWEITLEHIIAVNLFTNISLIQAFRLPTEKLHQCFAWTAFSGIFALSWVGYIGNGVFLPIFFPLAASIFLASACLMPLYPKPILLYSMLYLLSIVFCRYVLFGHVKGLEHSWLAFNLLCLASVVFAIMLRTLFEDMAGAILSKSERIEELTEINALLNITLDENQFGLVVYDDEGNLHLERGASIQRLLIGHAQYIDYHTLSATKSFFEKSTGQDFEQLMEDFFELEYENNHYIIRTYQFKNSTILTHMDVTQIRKIEAELRAHQKLSLVGEITSGVAHNYNNSLAIALANLETFPSSKHKNLWQEIICPSISAIEQSVEISHKLLALAGRQNLNIHAFELGEIVKNMRPLLASALGEEVELSIEVENNIWIETDSHELKSAILNLVINSRNAMDRPNSKVDIAVGQNEKYGYVYVKDNGHGIDQAIKEKVFDPFFSTKKTPFSSGLGLSTVKGFVEQSHGHVELETSPKGTKISLFFPFCNDKKLEEATQFMQSSDQLSRSASLQHILVVDDNSQVAKSFCRLVQNLGYPAIYETSASKALKILKESTQITHAFIDLSMPEMDGISLGKEVLQKRDDIQIYLVTGETCTQRIRVALDAGLKNVFVKPLRAKDISKILSSDSVISNQIREAVK